MLSHELANLFNGWLLAIAVRCELVIHRPRDVRWVRLKNSQAAASSDGHGVHLSIRIVVRVRRRQLRLSPFPSRRVVGNDAKDLPICPHG
ncbi:hypothetical protein GUJ93_ZPchr0007g6251 [Zizania palustris]|uniref:Secreted protein n=1 Tax=Zizania palustris TaxID=103762 RepID=A0A8J5THX7_ZIZPA|nr:hypothetical protein GUJ93_ZPchr0007g6251 [Zizania palustris]